MPTTGSFRQAAAKRLRELEQADRDRQVAREARAAADRANQVELRVRRERAQAEQGAQQAGDVRSRLARRFGIAPQQVNVHGEYWAFAVGYPDVFVAISRPPGSTSRDNWRHQQRLQAAFGVGLDPPAILVGAQLVDAADGLGRLLMDPDAGALAALASPTEGPSR